ncbi:uncharacterized protein [Musca autumnalis]|uniref:uncharacterized protein n=1 Tax=Musca autumnalis TaxID=221902 RepID=UPI003CE8D060
MSDPATNKCRTCLSETENKAYFNLDDYVEEGMQILDMLDDMVPQLEIKKENKLPHHICQECVDKLLTGHRFQQQCIESNKRLLGWLGLTTITEENDEQSEKELLPQAKEGFYEGEQGELNIKSELDEMDGGGNESETDDQDDDVQEECNTTETRSDKKSASETDFSCKLCGKKFYRLYCLQRHTSRVHDEQRLLEKKVQKEYLKEIKSDSVFACSECGKTFRTLFNLQKHDKCIHNPRRGFDCDICSKHFATEKEYIIHMLLKHKGTHVLSAFEGGEHKEYDEKPSDDGDVNIKTEERPIKVHSQYESMLPKKKRSNEETVYACSSCGKLFSTMFNLRRHSLLHDNKRDFPCNICTYNFDTEQAYRKHMTIVHKMKDEKSKDENKPKENNDEDDTGKHFYEQLFKLNPEEIAELKKKSNDDENRGEQEPGDTEENVIQEEEEESQDDSDDEEEEVEDVGQEENIKTVVHIKTINRREHYYKNRRTGGEIEKPRSDFKKGNFPCNTCEKVFSTQARLDRHMPMHSPDRPYACEICKYRFQSSCRLRGHMLKHTEDENGREKGFECPDCSRRFERKSSLSVHRSQVHAHKTININTATTTSSSTPSSQFSYPCKVCQRNFISLRWLTEHIKNKHNEVKLHKCTKCHKAFLLHSHLLEHSTRYHQASKKYICTTCDLELPNKSSLKEHMRSQHGGRAYNCEQCGKKFQCASTFKQHMDRHNNLRQYQCSECPSRFNCRWDLKKHESSHTNAKPFVCDICGSSYTRNTSLTKHKLKHTGVRNFKCEHCNLAFYTAPALRTHMRTHTGEKPYKCKYCDRAYAQSGDLNKHLKTHMGENIYKCNECPMSFKYYNDLRQHIADHYKQSKQQQEQQGQQIPQQQQNVIQFPKNQQTPSFQVTMHHQANTTNQNTPNNPQIMLTITNSNNFLNAMSRPKLKKCRTCLSENQNEKFFQLAEYIEEEEARILDILNDIVPQIRVKEENKQLPQLVCQDCYDNLLNGHSFKQLCIESNNQLLASLKIAAIGKGSNETPGKRRERHTLVDSLAKADEDNDMDQKFDTDNDNYGTDSEELEEEPFKSDSDWEAEVAKEAVDNESDSDSSNEKLSLLKQRQSGKAILHTEQPKKRKRYPERKKHPCSVCGKLFRTPSDLRAHVGVHAMNRPFPCDICKTSYAKEANYLNHMATKHKEVFDDQKGEEHPCPVCSKIFYKKISLSLHMATHNPNVKKRDRSLETKSIDDEENDPKRDGNLTELQTDKQEAVVKHEIEISPEMLLNPLEDTTDDDQANVDNDVNVACFDEDQESDDTDKEDIPKKRKHRKTHNFNPDLDYVDTGIGEVEKPNELSRRNGNFPCQVCGKFFDRQYRLTRHMPVHSMDRPHACELCTYRFLTPHLLRIHMFQHKNKDVVSFLMQSRPEGYQCPECPRRFEKQASLWGHRQIHKRSQQDIIYPCTVCQEKVMSVKALIEHITTTHPEMEKHQCSQCEKSFVLRGHLVEHVNRHNGNMNFVCIICEREFRYTATLREHMRTHTDNRMEYLCPHCGKKCKSASSLSQHVNIHLNLKKYECPLCPKRFNNSTNRSRHMIRHRDERPFVCDMCGSSFKRANSLQMHKKTHTGEKPFKCEKCDKSFTAIGHMRSHMLTHTGEKPHKCEYCELAYAKKGDLTKHLRKHLGEKIYSCEQCPEKFKYYAELRNHLEEHYRNSQNVTKEQIQEISKDEPQENLSSSGNQQEDEKDLKQ